MNDIKLNDILGLTKEEVKNTTIRFMVKSKNFDPNVCAEDPGKRDELNFKHLVHNPEKKIHFKKDIIAIGFIPIHDDYWLMTGIVKISKDNGNGKPADAKYIEKYNKYNFRIVVKFHKGSRGGIRLAKTEKNDFLDELTVVEIWNSEKGLNDKFPGYKEVTVSYCDLKRKLDISEEWRTALRSRNGVYLISDKKTGKLYVGSAYGKDGILGRWETYLKSGYDKDEVENGKYPNQKFRELVKEEGLTYIQDNFQYSILESFTDDIPKEYIIARESWWKEALLSRKFGYNAN